MMRRFLTTAAQAGLVTCLLAYSAIAQGDEDAFAQWAVAHAHPVSILESPSDDSDLLALQSAIGGARVVALGEPMHGAREPLVFRNRLFRFLVEKMGFTAIGLESGFTESISARAFVERGEGNAETAARTGLSVGLSRYPETLELLQWMRDYNVAAAATGRRKLHLYGIDITSGGRKNGPWLAIDSALTFLSRGDPASAQTIRQSLGDSLSGLEAREFGSLPPAAQADFEAGIEALSKATRKSRKRLIAASSEADYRWALHNLEAARQLAKCLPITPPPQASMNLWVRATDCRDGEMAKNVQWAVENEGRQGRLLVFAHNGHVMNAKEDGRRLANVPFKPSMMGLHVRQAYGNDLYIMALICAGTSADLMNAKPPEAGSIESTLAGVGLPSFFVDVRSARKDKDAATWLATRRSVNANVSSQGMISLATAVDALVFVNLLTPSVLASAPSPPR